MLSFEETDIDFSSSKCYTETNMKGSENMSEKKRFAAAILAAVIAFALLFSVFYIAAEADHDCPGEECLICLRMDACRNTLRSFVSTSSALRITAVMLCFAAILRKVLPHLRGRATPVTLKVKISD